MHFACAHIILFPQRVLRCGRAEAACAADDKARRRLFGRFYFVFINKKLLRCRVVVVERGAFFLSRISLDGKADFITFRDNIKGRTEVTENMSSLGTQENTERPLGKYKQHHLQAVVAPAPRSAATPSPPTGGAVAGWPAATVHRRRPKPHYSRRTTWGGNIGVRAEPERGPLVAHGRVGRRERDRRGRGVVRTAVAVVVVGLVRIVGAAAAARVREQGAPQCARRSCAQRVVRDAWRRGRDDREEDHDLHKRPSAPR